MKEMEKTFLPRLNDFSEKLKEVHKIQANHIISLSDQLKIIKELVADLRQEMKLNNARLKLLDQAPPAIEKYYNEINGKIHEFELNAKEFRSIFQSYISDTNIMLGKISGHWGGYIEQVGVEYVLNLLRKDFGVHTWYQKYKRWWHKSQNVELDLVACSDTHAYIIEVKNQLKTDIIAQILTALDKIQEHIPELDHLQKQAIVLCVHAEEITLVNMLQCANVWVFKYAGFDNPKQKYEWVWLQKPC